jgi:hypothetical protein
MKRDQIEAELARHEAVIRGRKRGAQQAQIRREAAASQPLVSLLTAVLIGVMALALLAWVAWD